MLWSTDNSKQAR